MNTLESMRIDKWLWCARFYKTRSLAAEEIGKGRVIINGQAIKASRDVRPGDTVALRQGQVPRTVVVRALSNMRGPAPVAQALYRETPDSVARREAAAQARRLAPEPALAQPLGRPTKRDRRQLQQWQDGSDPGSDSGWGSRWSASL